MRSSHFTSHNQRLTGSSNRPRTTTGDPPADACSDMMTSISPESPYDGPATSPPGSHEDVKGRKRHSPDRTPTVTRFVAECPGCGHCGVAFAHARKERPPAACGHPRQPV